MSLTLFFMLTDGVLDRGAGDTSDEVPSGEEVVDAVVGPHFVNGMMLETEGVLRSREEEDLETPFSKSWSIKEETPRVADLERHGR